jgi:hypothetical protein
MKQSVGHDSAVGTAACYRLNVSGFWTPVGGVIFRTSHITSPAPCAVGTASFPGIKRLGRGAKPPTPFSAQVKERIELYIPHLCLHGMVQDELYYYAAVEGYMFLSIFQSTLYLPSLPTKIVSEWQNHLLCQDVVYFWNFQRNRDLGPARAVVCEILDQWNVNIWQS